MGFVDWGDGLDALVLGRFGRPYESLQSGDLEVEAWWSALTTADRRNFAVELNRGVVPTDPVAARGAVALLELQLRRYWLIYVGVAIPMVVWAVVIWLAGSVWWIAVGVLGLIPGLAIGRVRLERQLNTTRAIAELASRGRSSDTAADDA